MQDRCADVATRQREGLLGLGPDFVIECLVVERVGDSGWQTGIAQHRLESASRSSPASAWAPARRRQRINVARRIEDPGADRLVERPDRIAPLIRAHPRGDPQQPQASGMALFVVRREVSGVVDVRVEDPQ